MIAAFLRPPRGVGEWSADVLRVIGAISVAVAGFGWGVTDAGILAFALPALLLPRFLAVRPWFDLFFGVTVLVSAWSNVFDLYTTIAVWDIVVHFVATGVLAAMAYLLLAEVDVVPDAPGASPRAPLVIVPVLGLALSALWEMVEWVGYTFISDDIFVTYDDTIGDMAMGGIGALLAGFLVAYVPLRRASSADPRP